MGVILDNITIKKLTIAEGEIFETICRISDKQKLSWSELAYVMSRISNNMVSNELRDRIKRSISAKKKEN